MKKKHLVLIPNEVSAAREALKKGYLSKEKWDKGIDLMPEADVMRIYTRLKRQGKI